MASVYDAGNQTSGLPTYQATPAAPSNPYSDPAFAKASYDQMMAGANPQPGVIGGALSSAMHGAASQFGGFVQAGGQALGLPSVANWGAGVAQRQDEAAQANGRPDLEGQWASLPGFAYNLTKQLPLLAGTVAASRLGGGTAARLLGVSREAGEMGVAGAAMFPLSVGGNVEAAKAANDGHLSDADAYKAMLLGAPEAAIQSYMPGTLSETLRNGASGDLSKRLLMGGGINAIVGAGQGAATTALTGFMDPNKDIGQRARDIVQGAVSGAISGGVIGAAIHGISKAKEPLPETDPNAPTEALEAATKVVDPGAELDPNKVKVQPSGTEPGDQGSFVPPAPPMPQTDLSSPLGALPDTINGAVPRQLGLFTPEETGQRAGDVAALRKTIEDKYKIPANADRSFLDNLQATTIPELIKQTRDQAEFYIDAKKGSMPKWFEKLATDNGVMSNGKVVNLTDAIAEHQAVVDAAQAKYQEALGKISAKDAETKQGALKQAAAAKARDAATADAKAEIARLTALVPHHAEADTLPDVFSRREIPDTLKDKPSTNELWQTMVSVSDHAPTEALRGKAASAADALRNGDTKGIELAKQVQADYNNAVRTRMSVKTDEAAPTTRANDNTPGPNSVKTDEVAPKDVVNDNAPYKTDAVNDNTYHEPLEPGALNDNRQFGKPSDVTPAERPAGNSVKIDEAPPRAVNDDNSVVGERPEVIALKTDAAAPGAAENDNRPFGTERTPALSHEDALAENEKFSLGKAERDARLLNDNVAGYPNIAPRPEALAFARDAASMTSAQPPVAMHVIGPANKNQTPKQQAAIEKAAATRQAKKDAEVVNSNAASLKAQMDARKNGTTVPQGKTDVLGKPVATEPFKPKAEGFTSKPDILARMAEPASKRQGDDDIAYIVGNKDRPVNSSGKVLDYLSDHGDSDFVKLLASRLRKLGVDPTISWGTKEDILAASPGFDTKGLSAAYDEKANHIWLIDRTNLQSNFLHEMVHAATHAIIEKGGLLADRMQTFMDKAAVEAKARGLSDVYGLKSLHEFVAEAFSNPQFQKLLGDIPSSNPKFTLWDRFKDAISKLLNLPERARSLLDDAIRTGSQMMDEHAGNPAKPGSVANANAGAVIFGKRADDILASAKQMLADDGRGTKWLTGKVRETALGWNTFTHIADHYGHLLPSLKSVQNAWEGRDVLQARLHQMHKVARDAYSALPPKAQDAVTTLMGWTRHAIDPRLTWEQHTWLHQAKNADALRALVKQARDDWNKAWNLGGDAAHAAYNTLDFSNKSDHYMKAALLAHEYGSTAYRELNSPAFASNPGELFRHDTTGIHNDPQKAMDWWKTRLTDTLGALEKIRDEVVSPKLAVGDKTEQSNAKKEFDGVDKLIKDINFKTKAMEQAPYFHEGRQGDFAVSAKLNLGEDKQLIGTQVDALQKHLEADGFGQYGISRVGDNPSIFIKVKTADQMEALRRSFVKAQEKGLLDQKEEIQHGEPQRTELWNSVAPQYLKRMVDLAAKSKNFSKDAEAELRSRWLDMLGESSLPKAYQNRTEAQGWNKDMMHNFVVRSQVAAKSLSSTAMHGAVSDAMTQMDNEIQAHKAGTDSDKTLAAQQVASEVTRREMERNWHVDTTAQDYIRAINHTFHLGLSLPYAMEQLSQVPMLLLPELGKTHGFVSSAKAIAAVTPMAFKIMKAIASGPHALDAVVTPESLKAGGIDAKTTAFIMDIVNRAGLDLGSFTREYGVASKGGEEGVLSKAMHMANSTAIYAETFGRVLAALSARELHGADKEGHVEYAKNVLDQSMMSWQPWNTSRQTSKTGFFGAYSPLALSFTGYQTRMIEKLYREVHDAIKGETPESRAAAQKFLAMHLGAATCIAGTLGMPFMGAFAGAATRLSNFLTGDDRYDVENSYREFLAHTFGKEMGAVIAKGLPQAAGLDLADLGDQNLLPFTNFLKDRRKLEDSVGDWAKNAMGSPFATGLNFVAGARDIGAGLPLQGIAKMLPTSLKGPYDAARIATYGYEDKDGTKKPIDADVRDVLARVAGFHTAEEGEYNDKSRIDAGMKEARMEREGYIKQRLLLSMSHKDPSGYQSAVQDAAQFGKDHPVFQPMAAFGTARMRQLSEQARAKAFGMPLADKPKDIIDHGERLKW